MHTLKDKTIIITGASRGIGKAMALRFAAERANIVIAAKTNSPHRKLPGTIGETAEEVQKAGGKALAVKLDVRVPEEINAMVQQTVETFGGIDVLINNAGAISLTGVENTTVKLFDRMHQVNYRAVFLCSKAVLPYLKKSSNGHIINMSPPINLNPKWLKAHSPYTASKYAMSLLTIGMAEEFKSYSISVTSLWPKTLIATAAIEFAVGDKEMLKRCRKPEILADAAYEIIKTKNNILSGQTLIDEAFLRQSGVRDDDFRKYAVDPENDISILGDIFVD